MAEIYQLPNENSGSNGANIPFSIPIGFGGMGNNGFGFGNGMNGIYDLLGVAIIASLFGWNGGGFGNGGFGGGNSGAAFLANQLSNDSGRELIMNAVTNQGEASRTAIRNAEKAIRILSNYNTGMAVSNETLKMSAIYISDTTSIEQFWDTCAHELAHVCTSIIDAYDVDYRSEDAAYLSGFLMRQLVREIGEPCR